MQLSKHLSLAEFIHSNTALKLGIDNTLPKDLINNAHRVAELFEVVRTIVDRPCRINSGYRNATLNSLVGGSKTSNHMMGCACDIRMKDDPHQSRLEQEHIKNHFIMHRDGIEFDQLILYWKNGQRFVHIGVSPDPNIKGRKMIGYRNPKDSSGYEWI